MTEQLKELKAAMAELEAQNEYYADAKKAFDIRMFTTTEIIKATKEQIEKIKDEIRPMAIVEFKETGNKKLLGGIGIRETSFIEYDESKAFEFAKEKDLFLQLDKKSFEKAAPGMNLDFVTTGKNPSVTFPAVIKLEGEQWEK